MLELVTFLVLPEDLPDHGPQHDQVEEEHHAEESQVHHVMDQRAREPASRGGRKAEGYAVSSHGGTRQSVWGEHAVKHAVGIPPCKAPGKAQSVG